MSIMGNERRLFLEGEAETEHLGRELIYLAVDCVQPVGVDALNRVLLHLERCTAFKRTAFNVAT